MLLDLACDRVSGTRELKTMMRPLTLGIVAAMLSMLAGCSSGFEKFYQESPELPGSVKILRNTNAEPVVLTSTGNPDADYLAMFTRGLGHVGQSYFNGPQESASGAINQAKKVGATHIVMSSQYSRTVQGAMPITTPNTTTSFTSGQVQCMGVRRLRYRQLFGYHHNLWNTNEVSSVFCGSI